jgi:hypothetical protein
LLLFLPFASLLLFLAPLVSLTLLALALCLRLSRLFCQLSSTVEFFDCRRVGHGVRWNWQQLTHTPTRSLPKATSRCSSGNQTLSLSAQSNKKLWAQLERETRPFLRIALRCLIAR